MPNNCSAPGCKSNYDPTDRIPVFKMPQKPDELRHAWLRVLHRDDINELKVVYVCSKHFTEDEVETTHKVPNGDGSYREIPRNRPKLKDGAVPTILPGCPRYYSHHTATKRTRLSLEDKDDELLYQAVKLSLESDIEENEKFKIHSFHDLQAKLPLLSIASIWSTWYPDEYTLIIMRPRIDSCKIEVNSYLSVNFDLSVKLYHNGVNLPISIVTLCDVRQIDSLLNEISIPPSAPIISEDISTNFDNTSHIASAESHIQQVIDNMYDGKSDDDLVPCPEVSRLQFVLCQLRNCLVPKRRRRYNVLTQILALKTHLISPASYHYLQSMSCISLPHSNTLKKLYSSFGLENEFFMFLKESTYSFSQEQRHVIIQMDEIHVKPDISHKGGRLFASNLDPDNPTKTVFAIMVSSLYKKWSCIVRLLPCASVTAEKLFDTIKSCIHDVEDCGLFVEIISTDNYPLNVKLFKLFSPNKKLETRVPHPCDIRRGLFLTFDFVHILKTIRNNWLNQQTVNKLFSYPDLNCFSIDRSAYPLKICHASFRDIRMLYNSERDSLAKLAPRLTSKACYPSNLERQNVKLVLKVVHESTIAALAIQDEQRSPAFKCNTSDFVGILLSLWKIFNINMPYKHIRLNDPLSNPIRFNDERFLLLTRIVYWLELGSHCLRKVAN